MSRSKTLKDVAFYVGGRINNSVLTDSTYIGVDNMLPNRAGIKASDYTPKEGTSIFFKKGDILIGNIRPYFKKIWLATFNGGCSQDVLCIRPKEGVSSEFLYALLSQDSFFNYDMAGAKGSKMPRGDKKHIMAYPIKEIEKPVCVGNFIININQKIIINNAINAELEAMAKTIYDYWFLQFEFPDENGKPYKSSGGKMVYNEELKREIPEGWEIHTIGELLSFDKGKIPAALSDSQETATQAPYLTIAVVNGEEPQYCERHNMPLCNGATVMVMDGAASGDVYVGNVGVLGSTFAMLTSKRSDISDAMIYNILRANQKVYKRANTGSTVPHANRQFIESMKVALPPNMNLQSQTFDKIQKVINRNKKENQELASLRDFLLPLLMNGQVGFKD